MRALADSTLHLSVGNGVCKSTSQGGGITLRADLRALATIARRYDDFADLYGRIVAFDYTATVDLIRATSTDPDSLLLPSDPDWVSYRALDEFFTLYTPQLLTFIERIAGAGDADSAEPSDPITLTELIERLFKIGAGWLEWAPDDVWNATPAEILLARDGLIEKLKAIHGSKDEETRTTIDLTKRRLSADDKSRLNKMGGLG